MPPLLGERSAMTAPPVEPPEKRAAAPVTVTDIDMPFVSMVWFMVKWAIATIPALLILIIAGALCIAVLGGLGMGLGRLGSAAKGASSSLVESARDAMAPGALTVSVEEKSDAWWIANQTDYLWNVCWAERRGQRAIVPTMNPKATVAVRHDEFVKTGSAHQGSDLQVTCSYDGTDVASPLTIQAVIKP